MKFEKGKQYECLVWRGDLFTEGKIYPCDMDGYLKDNDKMDLPISPHEYKYFKLHEPEPKLGEKVLVWDDDEMDAKELIFLANAEERSVYLVFESDLEYDDFINGIPFVAVPYENMKTLPQVETVSLKEALSILEAHKGVKCRIEGCE